MSTEKSIKIIKKIISSEDGGSYIDFAYLFFKGDNIFCRWEFSRLQLSYTQLLRLKEGLEDFLHSAKDMGYAESVRIALEEIDKMMLLKETRFAKLRRCAPHLILYGFLCGYLALQTWFVSDLLGVSLSIKQQLTIGMLACFIIYFIRRFWRETIKQLDVKIDYYYSEIIRHLKKGEIEEEWQRADKCLDEESD